MENTGRYFSLEKYKGRNSRYKCPNCGAEHEFVRYVDQFGNYLHETVGKCNRVIKCGYHLTPSEFFKENGITPKIKQYVKSKDKEMSTIDISIMLKTNQKKHYESQPLYKWLITKFPKEVVDEVYARYYIGTTKEGATIYWQLDRDMHARSGKIIHYDNEGHRIKDLNATWVHSVMKLKDFTLNQCLFGLHLIKSTPGKIAIVESEKTAIYMTCVGLNSNNFANSLIWLATGGMNNVSQALFQPLVNRDVILFPDGNAVDYWNEKIMLSTTKLIFNSVEINKEILDFDKDNKGLDLADLF